MSTEETIIDSPRAGSESTHAEKNAFLVGLGERARALRARRGMTRKAVASSAGVSERHLANLEYGEGNASILVLLQVAGALQCSLAELIGDITKAQQKLTRNVRPVTSRTPYAA